MNAAAERAALAAIGRDLIALSGDPGERRAAALLSPAPDRPAACFRDIAGAPDWLRLPREEQRLLAIRAALLGMAPMLAGSIDGEWMGELAKLAGEATLDWAIAQAGDVPGAGLSAIPADEVPAAGFALLRAALPAPLAPYLDWADSTCTPPGDAALASFCAARAAAMA